MKSRMLTFFTITMLHVWEAEPAPAVAKPRQFIPPLPGYIPVYIRPGDTPLEDINPDLAEAFQSFALKHGRISSDSALSHNVLGYDGKDESDSPAKHGNVQSGPGVPKTVKHTITLTSNQHIQKIPIN